MTNANAPQNGGFYGLGIAPSLLDILAKLKYVTPTPIQEKAIPVAIQGSDVIGIAQTGTGKTLAFSLPMLMRIAATKGKGLVLLPTRELALQVDETLQKIGMYAGLRTAVLIGGASMNNQIAAIKKNPHVIVATPGRLNDHLDQKTVDLSKVAVLVLDEADRMLDMGFAPQINRVLKHVPSERQTMLFSATMPPEISKMAAQYMATPVRVEIARAGTAAERVDQELFVVDKPDKLRLLDQLLQQYHGTVLVFSRTKHGAAKITRALKKMGFTAAEIHSNRSLNQRKDALEGFKTGKYRVLVATDIAARGIDVTGIELVVNFDLPDQAEDYVHRIGRTGRAGRAGKAVSFATPDQGKDVREIEKLVRMQLAISKTPNLPVARAVEAYESRDRERDDRNRQRQHGSRGGARGTQAPRRPETKPQQPSAPAAGKPQPAGSRQSYDQEYRKDKRAPARGQAGRRQENQGASRGGSARRGKMAPRKFFGGMGV